MTLATVTGRTWATVAHPTYDGRTVYAVAPEVGEPFLAVDSVGARPGDTVLVAREGNTARQVLEAHEQPVHAVIIGIVDSVERT